MDYEVRIGENARSRWKDVKQIVAKLILVVRGSETHAHGSFSRWTDSCMRGSRSGHIGAADNERRYRASGPADSFWAIGLYRLRGTAPPGASQTRKIIVKPCAGNHTHGLKGLLKTGWR